MVDERELPPTGTPMGSSASLGSMTWLVIAAKVVFAFLGFSALVTEIATLTARHRFAPGNFFSYFTVESNTLAVISLMLGALAAARGRQSRALVQFRGAVSFFMTTVILIFIVLLSGFPASELTAVPWDNTVLNYVMPVVVIVDWLLFSPRAAVPVRSALVWLLVPLAYLVYSLVRGAVVGWYPYPFMNPVLHGYATVLVTLVVIAVVLAVIVAVRRSSRGGRRSPDRSVSSPECDACTEIGGRVPRRRDRFGDDLDPSQGGGTRAHRLHPVMGAPRFLRGACGLSAAGSAHPCERYSR